MFQPDTWTVLVMVKQTLFEGSNRKPDNNGVSSLSKTLVIILSEQTFTSEQGVHQEKNARIKLPTATYK